MTNKVIGAGICGLVLARRLAEIGEVIVYEHSNHIGGLLYDYLKDDYLVSDSGVHIFHTNEKEIFKYLESFGMFCSYNHIVSSDVYGTDFSINFPPSKNNRLTKEQFSNLYSFYSLKQWGNLPSQNILDRVKAKDDNSLYFFKDKYIGLPLFGWTKLCESIANHPNIKIVLNHQFKLSDIKKYDRVYFSGRLDMLFNYCYGEMKYRTIEIAYSNNGNDYANVMNKSLPDIPYTRVINWRRCNPKIVENTKDLYGYEFSRDSLKNEISPHYIVEGQENIYQLYKKECEKYNIIPFGRIGGNKYINIDEGVKCALTLPL